ncbi:MAG: rod shape-determining protein MreD [Oscillospiraceae bacterium]|jgi:rod shape-determining protein MreD|nr:rod shape-determining protein MreD [Oscillospiraceae bacterium]
MLSVLRKSKRNQYIRRLLLSLLVFLVATAQSVPWLPLVFGAAALPLLPLVVCIAVLEQEVPAILFGALAGLCWDAASPDPRGWHALYLTVVAFVCAALMRYILNRNIWTVTLLSSAAAFVYLLLRWLLDAFSGGTGLEPSSAVVFYLPRFAYTMVLLAPCYALVRGIVRKTARKRIDARISETGGIGQIRS